MLPCALVPACADSSVPPLSELGGEAFTLVAFDRSAPAPREPAVTLAIEDERVTGGSGCNRYFASFTLGDEAGDVRLGPVGATRQMCPPAEMEIEDRYLRALGHVVSYRFYGRTLELLSREAGVETHLSFAR